LIFTSSWALSSTLLRRELYKTCCLSWLSVSSGSKSPIIPSRRLIQLRMMGWLAGSVVRRPPPRHVFPPYFARKPGLTGDRGVWSAQCAWAMWVTVVSTLGAEVQESSSPPSFPSSPSSCRHSMTSGAFGSEAICSISLLTKLIFCFLPKLVVSGNTDLSVCLPQDIESTKWSVISPRGCYRQSFRRTRMRIVRR